MALAKEKTGNAGLKQEDLRQDEDCLDTWFSSWLWPISLFDGINTVYYPNGAITESKIATLKFNYYVNK